MIPKDMRFSCHRACISGSEAYCFVYDADQRRWITVAAQTPWLDREDDDKFNEQWQEMRARSKKIVEVEIDEEHDDTVGIILLDETENLAPILDDPEFPNSQRFPHGRWLRFVGETDQDLNVSTYYPLLEEYQLPSTVKTVLRSELTELERLSLHVDLVSYAGMEQGVFKYAWGERFGPMWQEINIHARLPKHPNILALDRVVLDEISGSRVVGFTVPFIAGGDLDTNKDRPFKLKHLKQLMQAVDDLNYKFGIIHQDITPGNLFIDPATDNLIVFDLGIAVRPGLGSVRYHVGEGTGELKERNDVKGVVITVHEILTRDPRYKAEALHYLDETELLAGPEKWVKHPDVELEPGLDAVDYYDELMRWVRARRTRPITSHTDASEPLDWPQECRDRPKGLLLPSYDRAEAEQLNLPYIEWHRPRSAYLDRSRRLLATGKYADERAIRAAARGKAKSKAKAAAKPRTQIKDKAAAKNDAKAKTKPPKSKTRGRRSPIRAGHQSEAVAPPPAQQNWGKDQAERRRCVGEPLRRSLRLRLLRDLEAVAVAN